MKETSTDEQTKRNKKRRTLIQQAISKQASALNIAVLPFGFCGTWASADALAAAGFGSF
jgi:hypothetical protein